MSDHPIDVRDLIARYSTAEHVARADAYFASMPDNPALLRKPFFGLRDTPYNMFGIGEVLTRLRLFPGAVVLDFGAGTGWLSRALALLDCAPVAVDVSAAALAIGRRALEADPVAAGLSVEWRQFDGHRLPLDDASVDRVVCYDSFHHVADQAATLAEFYRVLRPGGCAVFHEPGPEHSRAPQSQFEMRHHDVIENDIVVEEIWRVAEALGFTRLLLCPAAPVSATLPLSAYDRVIAGQPTAEDVAALLAPIRQAAPGLRIFSLDKGEAVADSRQAEGLAGTFEVALTETTGAELHGRASVTNTGRVRWRASGPGAGAVFLGVRLSDAGRGPDFGRVWLGTNGVEPGETVTVAFTLPQPPRPARLVFDLVSELVVWFETLGSKPVAITLPGEGER